MGGWHVKKMDVCVTDKGKRSFRGWDAIFLILVGAAQLAIENGSKCNKASSCGKGSCFCWMPCGERVPRLCCNYRHICRQVGLMWYVAKKVFRYKIEGIGSLIEEERRRKRSVWKKMPFLYAGTSRKRKACLGSKKKK